MGVLPVLQTYRDRIARYARARQLDIWYALIAAQQFIALFVPDEQKHSVAGYTTRALAVQSSARLRNSGCSAG